MPPAPLHRRAPDPARAHGAWVYLIVSTLAGALAAVGQGLLPALFAGIGFIGVFLVASSLALAARRSRGRLLLGLAVSALSTGLALGLGADPIFLAYAAIAVFPAGASAWFAHRHGFLSPPALSFGVVALVVAAPAAACAGGAPPRLGWALLVLLAPFFAWRTWRVRTLLESRHWKRPELRALGLRESVLTSLWTALAVGAVHLLA